MGERVLGIASKELHAGTVDIAEEEKRGMTVVGFLAFADPLKETSKPAFDMLGRMGITLKIITGDSREVAGAVGYRLGLINDPGEVITGDEFSALSPDEKIEAAARHSVFARTLPMQKYEIIAALRQRYSVGFLGEGFNDVPALKIATLALAVENASDMTRNVSDVILLERDLMVIAQGVANGRKIFANVLKYIRTTLAANIGNFFSVAFASMILPFLPMRASQILLVNLITDFPMVSVAVDTVAEAEISRPRTPRMRDLSLFVAMFGALSALFDFIFFGSFLKFGEHVLQSGWFFFAIVTEVVAFFSLRSLLPIEKAGMPSRLILTTSALAVFASVALLYTPTGATLFHLQPLGAAQMQLIAAIVALYVVANELLKRIYARFVNPTGTAPPDRNVAESTRISLDGTRRTHTERGKL
jgi:Mg2+-importing ATPase